MQVRSLDQEDPLEEDMATHSNTLAWRIPWTEEPSGLQPKGSQRVGRDWACMHGSARRPDPPSQFSELLVFSDGQTLQVQSLSLHPFSGADRRVRSGEDQPAVPIHSQ